MWRLLCISLPFCICITTRCATPSYSDFNPAQFQSNPTGPQPKITLLSGGTVTNYVIVNITNTVLVSSNGYFTNISTTNIIVETVQNITNISDFTYVTNLYTTVQITTNLYATYLTASNANISGYLRNALDNGTNETFWGSTIFNGDVFFVGPGAPVLDLANGDTGLLEAGYDTTNHGGWWGPISPTNIDLIAGANITFTTNNHSVTVAASGVVSSQYYASNALSGGVFPTNTLSATAGANGWVLGQSNAAPVWTQNGAGLTNVTAVTLATGATINTANGSALTNLVYQYPTNVTGNGIFAMQTEYITNFNSNITLGTPTLNNAYYETLAVFCTNRDSAVHSITCAAGILGPPGSGNPAVFFVTNGANSYSWIYFEHHGGIISAKAQPYAP